MNARTDPPSPERGIINSVIHFSVNHRGVVLVLTALAALVGWMGFQRLSIDAVPDITNVQVQANTPIQGLAPEEIERYITFPVEAAMSGLAGVTEVRSTSRFGLSQGIHSVNTYSRWKDISFPPRIVRPPRGGPPGLGAYGAELRGQRISRRF